MRDSKRIVAFGCSNTYGHGLVDCYVNGGPGPKPSMFAWPQLVAEDFNTRVVNEGKPGASNLEILTRILQFDFKPDDMVIIMWSTTDRDYILGHKPLQIGAWQSSDIVKDWINVHSEEDLAIRSWLYFQHAELYLKDKNIEQFHFYSFTRGLRVFKPNYINVNIVDVDVNKDDLALDNLHMGPKSHIRVANSIKRVIDANRH